MPLLQHDPLAFLLNHSVPERDIYQGARVLIAPCSFIYKCLILSSSRSGLCMQELACTCTVDMRGLSAIKALFCQMDVKRKCK